MRPLLLVFPNWSELLKAYIHGHYRLNRRTGKRVWIESHQDKRPERGRTTFANWAARRAHFEHHLAHGKQRLALHAFHDLNHADSHTLATELGLAQPGESHADKGALMEALHGALSSRAKVLGEAVAEKVRADWTQRKASGKVGKPKRAARVAKPAAAPAADPAPQASDTKAPAADGPQDGDTNKTRYPVGHRQMTADEMAKVWTMTHPDEPVKDVADKIRRKPSVWIDTIAKELERAKAERTADKPVKPMELSDKERRVLETVRQSRGESFSPDDDSSYNPLSWSHLRATLNGMVKRDLVMRETDADGKVSHRVNETYLEHKLKGAPAVSHDEGPQDGDTKTENGVTYTLRGGRWHRDTLEPGVEASLSEALEQAAQGFDREADDWEGRVYKKNKTQIDLRGDGPSNRDSMSVGSINEGRRRKRVEFLRKAAAAIRKFAKRSESDRLNEYTRTYNLAHDALPMIVDGKEMPREEILEMYLNENLGLSGYHGKGTPGHAIRLAMEPIRIDAERKAEREAEAKRLSAQAASKPMTEDEQEDFLNILFGHADTESKGETKPARKDEKFTSWKKDRYAVREVGDVIHRKDGAYVVTSADMPTYVRDDAMSFGAPGGMESGWVQDYTAAKLPDLPAKDYPADKRTTFDGLFKQAETGRQYAGMNDPGKREEALKTLGPLVGVYHFPGRPGSYATTNSVRVHENGIVAVEPVYDDAPMEWALTGKDVADKARAALEGPDGESPDAARARDWQAHADATLKQWGVTLPEKTIGTRQREKAAAPSPAPRPRRNPVSRSRSPAPAATAREPSGGRTATYKGRKYTIGWQSTTKTGAKRTRLVMSDGRDFWVDTSALEKAFRSDQPGGPVRLLFCFAPR